MSVKMLRAPLYLAVVVAPDIVVALDRTLWRTPRRLEPGMLIRSVVDYQFGDYLQIPAMRFVDELVEVRHVPDIRMHVVIVGDIVTVVTPAATDRTAGARAYSRRTPADSRA